MKDDDDRGITVDIDITINGEENQYVTTAVHILREQRQLLRDVARMRCDKHGGRQSVSDIIRDLIQDAGPKFREELANA